jgi:hypothetical protein
MSGRDFPMDTHQFSASYRRRHPRLCAVRPLPGMDRSRLYAQRVQAGESGTGIKGEPLHTGARPGNGGIAARVIYLAAVAESLVMPFWERFKCNVLGRCAVRRARPVSPLVAKMDKSLAETRQLKEVVRNINESGVWPRDMIAGTYRPRRRKPYGPD